jgi:hypothetical protein
MKVQNKNVVLLEALYVVLVEISILCNGAFVDQVGGPV